MTHRRNDPGVPGTLRWIRRMELGGLSQKAFGRKCQPRLEQAQVSLFEVGSMYLSDAMARRLAPAIDPKLYAKSKDEARLKVYRVWLANVEAYNDDPDFEADARDLVARVTSFSPGPLYHQSHGGTSAPFSSFDDHLPARKEA